ncbi:MAG: hypothetical protein IPI77_23505 [Saprospiraceae bacterium]|nr:hypothetical protein [Saprospiraceae bacterium]
MISSKRSASGIIAIYAPNQIWHAADNGKEEMDLIHYAMVGGMQVSEFYLMLKWQDGKVV